MQIENEIPNDSAFKQVFHTVRKQLFESNSLLEMQQPIDHLLELADKIDHKKYYDPMPNFEAVKLELQSMKYGLENWETIKKTLIQKPGIQQTELIATTKLDKGKASLFLYRIALFGVILKSKVKNRNAFEFINERLFPETTIKNWDNMWEIPYQAFQQNY